MVVGSIPGVFELSTFVPCFEGLSKLQRNSLKLIRDRESEVEGTYIVV